MKQQNDKFYGRIKTRPLTVIQKELFISLYPKISIESISEIPSNFPVINFEVGFGGGEHICALALQRPNELFIGCEPFINGVASLLVLIHKYNINNIAIFKDDAKKLIRELNEDMVNNVFLLFPDPWPKRKHHKRRFFNHENIVNIHRIMKKSGEWRIATDHGDYAKSILKTISTPSISELFKIEINNKNNRANTEEWPITRYEQKSKNEILFLKLIKK